MKVVLYARPGCHLCDDARAALDDLGVAYDEVDIESDDALFKRYLERIPVIAIDGAEAFELVIDPTELALRFGTVSGR
jgi:glutaredoxin